MKAGKIWKNFHKFLVFFAYSQSDWSVKMRLLRFPAMGNEQNSAETFDSYLQLSPFLLFSFFTCLWLLHIGFWEIQCVVLAQMAV